MEPLLLYWHWLIFGLVLMAVEAFAPGAFFLWLGVSGLLVGLVLIVLPGLGLQAQILLFAVLVMGSLAVWWRRRRASEIREPQATPLNERTSLYLGRRFTLSEPIINGVGQLRVDDGQWRISGPDLPAGCAVKVVEVEGTRFRVEKTD